MRTALLLLSAVIFLCASASAQALAVGDTANSRLDTAAAGTFVMAKSPTGAAIRSAIVPGLGQFYNESYWKIPVVLGLTGFLAYGYFKESDSYATYRDLYAASITASNPSGELVWKNYREFYRGRRDTYAWWFLVSYLLQIADAYIDAHLYDFDVSDERPISLGMTGAGRLSLSIRF